MINMKPNSVATVVWYFSKQHFESAALKVSLTRLSLMGMNRLETLTFEHFKQFSKIHCRN